MADLFSRTPMITSWLRRLALLLVLSCLNPSAFAATDVVLEEAMVTVESRAAAARDQGFRDALVPVLLRLTGDPRFADSVPGRELLTGASGYVQQFRFGERSPAAESGIGLWVRFDRNALERALGERGVPVWRTDRPAALLWVAVQSGVERFLLGGDTAGELMGGYVAPIAQQARERGLPVIYPLLDLEERGIVSITDILSGQHDGVLAVSRRYNPGSVIVVSVTRRGSAWQSRWYLYDGLASNEYRGDWMQDGASLEAVLTAGIDTAATNIAQRQTVLAVGAPGDGVLVSVEGVGSLADYRRVHDFLSGLSVVSAVRPLRVEPQRSVFVADVRGDERALERSIAQGSAQGSVLARLPPTAGSVTPGLTYRLLR